MKITAVRLSMLVAVLALLAAFSLPAAADTAPATAEGTGDDATFSAPEGEAQPDLFMPEPERKIPYPQCDPYTEYDVATTFQLSPLEDGCASQCQQWCSSQGGSVDWYKEYWTRATCYCRCCIPG